MFCTCHHFQFRDDECFTGSGKTCGVQFITFASSSFLKWKCICLKSTADLVKKNKKKTASCTRICFGCGGIMMLKRISAEFQNIARHSHIKLGGNFLLVCRLTMYIFFLPFFEVVYPLYFLTDKVIFFFCFW